MNYYYSPPRPSFINPDDPESWNDHDSPYFHFFDFPAWERDNAETMSESSVESSQTPALTLSSVPTPPSETLPLDEYNGHPARHSDARRTDTRWIVPQPDPRQPPYMAPQLYLPNSCALGPAYSPPAPKRSSGRSGKRHLQNPDKTAEVRENGACIRCRAKKVKCDLKICGRCDGFPKELGRKICIREHLSTIGPAFIHVEDHLNIDDFVRRVDHTGQTRQFPIVFAGTARPITPLLLTIQEYRRPDSSAKNFAIQRERMPSWEELADWAFDQMLDETSSPFQQALDMFVLNYAQSVPVTSPMYELVNKVRLLRAMFKIYTTDGFHCVPASHSKRQVLHKPVAAELRHIAKKAVESIERDILNDLDDSLTQLGLIRGPNKRPFWVCLWQLILHYRFLATKSSSGSVIPRSSHARSVAEKLYTAVVVLYSGYFKTGSDRKLATDMSAIPDHLHDLFYSILDLRMQIYEDIESSKDSINQMLRVLIVDTELKELRVLQKRRKKAAKKSQSATKQTYTVDEDYYYANVDYD